MYLGLYLGLDNIFGIILVKFHAHKLSTPIKISL